MYNPQNNPRHISAQSGFYLEAARLSSLVVKDIPQIPAASDMADTPSIPLPLNPEERPILESLQRIRDELTLLKQDRTTYVKTKDVMALYDRLVDQVQLLNDIRAEKPVQENRG